MVELVTFGETPLRISPPDKKRVEMAQEASLYADGVESNVAVAAQELGADSLWLSKLPETAVGRNVMRQIESHGVETEITWSEMKEHRQGITFHESVVAPREEKTWQDRQHTAAGTAEPADFPMGTVQNAAVVFTALSTAVLSQQAKETSQALLRASGGSGAVTAVDLDYEPGLASASRYQEVFEDLSKHLDVLIATEDDVTEVLDKSGNARELASILGADYSLEVVVITRDDGSAVTLYDTPGTNVIHERNSVETELVDPAGQHGVFIGAFLSQLIEGADEARSLSYAVAARALAGTIPGPFLTTTEDELEPIVDDVIENTQ